MIERRDVPAAGAEGGSTPGLILANLDCEHAWLQDLGRPATSAGGAARLRATVMASILRVFARSEHDRIWTPEAPPPGGWCPLPGVESPDPITGPIRGRYIDILAWGETRDAQRLRARSPWGGEPDPGSFGSAGRPDWMRRLWSIRPGAAEIAARVNDRSFALELGRSLGLALPGEAIIETVDGFEAWIAGGGADASPTGRWIAREPLSAAGRGRLVGEAGGDLAEQQPVLEAMLRRQGRLHCAPLMERIADFGMVGLADETGVQRVGWHRQAVRGLGDYAGSCLLPDRRWPAPNSAAASTFAESGLTREGPAMLDRSFERTGEALLGAGYRGPFGIDAWTYRDRAGLARLHALGEINARLTMGHAAWAFVDRFAGLLGWADAGEIRLRIGRMGASPSPAARERDRWMLARWKGRAGPSAMWMEAGAGRG